jgi:hypothetical protein
MANIDLVAEDQSIGTPMFALVTLIYRLSGLSGITPASQGSQLKISIGQRREYSIDVQHGLLDRHRVMVTATNLQ